MNPQDMITDKQQYQNPIANFFNILFAESLRNDRNEIQIDGFAGLVNILCQWGIAPTIQEVGMTCDEKASSYHRPAARCDQKDLSDRGQYPPCTKITPSLARRFEWTRSNCCLVFSP